MAQQEQTHDLEHNSGFLKAHTLTLSPTYKPKAVMGGSCIEVSLETNYALGDAPEPIYGLEETTPLDVFSMCLKVPYNAYEYEDT